MDNRINHGHEADFLIWAHAQVELLRARRFDQLDLANIIGELEDLAHQERSELKQRIEKLMLHLLNCKLEPEHIPKIRLSRILAQRHRIKRLLEDMPSLASIVDEHMETAYARAAAAATNKVGVPRSVLPTTAPFTKAQLLDVDYIP